MRKNFLQKKSFQDCRDAIEFMDYMVLCLEAGHHVQHAFFMAAMNLSSGRFREQCFEALKFYELGFSFGEALRKTPKLCPVANDVFENLILSLKLGAKVVKILTHLSAQLRLNMIGRLEELAHETPVKMIFPLVIFIFPVIFILLGTKTLLNFVQSLGG